MRWMCITNMFYSFAINPSPGVETKVKSPVFQTEYHYTVTWYSVQVFSIPSTTFNSQFIFSVEKKGLYVNPIFCAHRLFKIKTKQPMKSYSNENRYLPKLQVIDVAVMYAIWKPLSEASSQVSAVAQCHRGQL